MNLTQSFKYSKPFAFSVLTLGLTACQEQDIPEPVQPDIEISISTNSHWGTLVFAIQSLTDQTTISAVKINRGNCRLAQGTSKEISRTVSLKFGQSYSGYSNNCTVDNVKEIEVTSNAGSFVYSF